MAMHRSNGDNGYPLVIQWQSNMVTMATICRRQWINDDRLVTMAIDWCSAPMVTSALMVSFTHWCQWNPRWSIRTNDDKDDPTMTMVIFIIVANGSHGTIGTIGFCWRFWLSYHHFMAPFKKRLWLPMAIALGDGGHHRPSVPIDGYWRHVLPQWW
jgi:hypothetical protein